MTEREREREERERGRERGEGERERERERGGRERGRESNMHMALFRVRDGPISARVRPVQAEPLGDRPIPYSEQCHMHFLARYQFSTNLNQYNNRKNVLLDLYLNLQRFHG